MNMLITDSAKGVFLLRGGETPVYIPTDAEYPCMPAASRERLIVASAKSRDCFVVNRRTLRQELHFPAPPGLSAMCPSPCERWLYQLSTEADAVHAVHLGSGELHFAYPAGVFPRSMRLSSDGNLLLIAGGALNEAYLLTAPELEEYQTIFTRHPCFAADFWRDGLVLVCAAEGEAIQTVVYTLTKGRRRPREIQRLAGQPGAIKVCPDQTSALLSTPDGLMKIDLLDGSLQWNVPQAALCMGIEYSSGLTLLSDMPRDEVILVPLSYPYKKRILWQGGDAQACFV